jgi:hypothetical protein
VGEEGRLPTALWVDACLQPLAGRGIFHYITNKGEHYSGIILLKLNGLKGRCRLLTQQRDFETDKLGWVPALSEETVEEAEADDYIQRAITRDPDLWVIEIEDAEMVNPFE